MLIHDISWQEYFFEAPTVTLDGIVQRDVIAADDQVGRIVRYKRDADGNLVRKGHRYDVEVVSGAVVITGRLRGTFPEERAARAQTKRDRRMIKRAEIARRQARKEGSPT